MKSICWILSILALLVISTVDARPDPPAINPAGGVCKLLTLDQHSDDAALTQRVELPAAGPFDMGLIWADVPETFRPIDQPDFTALASDPSPPRS